jgi:hypothetical protein
MSAVLSALFEDHDTGVGVRTRLVKEGFPTDRVELTSLREPGQASLGPANGLADKLADYFHGLFDGEQDRSHADSLAAGVRSGRAAITVHPRGEVETSRALEILRDAGAIALKEYDLDNQTLEQAASPEDQSVAGKLLESAGVGAKRPP